MDFLYLTQGSRRPAALGDGAEGRLVIGVDREGICPEDALPLCDLALTVRPRPPQPWVGVPGRELDACLAALALLDDSQAATALAGVLRAGETCRFEDALRTESLTYSMLLGGDAFRAWRARVPVRADRAPSFAPVRLERTGATLRITLSDVATGNALSAAMRDQLCDALDLPRLDPSIQRVVLSGDGSCFSSGGHLDEFGSQPDLDLAHAIRLDRSVAARIAALGDRATVFVHGRNVGGGVEIAAAAARVFAHPDATFRLPEIEMGLIPGAGGCVTLPPRIGRHRTACLALTGWEISAPTAYEWGLVDAIRLSP